VRNAAAEILVELRNMPFAQGAVAGAALAAAGGAMRRPREGMLAGLAAGIAVHTAAGKTAAVERAIRNSEDVATIAARLGPYLPSLGNWAIDADFARLVLREMESGPEVVVELGSGLSTLLIGSILEERATGRLASIDHDPRFAGETSDRLQRSGNGGRVEVTVAPLRDQSFAGTTTPWYDAAAVIDALPPGPIDLLIVDGPPSTSTWTRWPAIEVLAPHLAPGAIVLLDDGRRREERASALRWAREHPDLKLWWLDTLKGAWRLERHGPQPEPASIRATRRIFRILNPSPPVGFGRLPVLR
jgi:predicted O-methyltransferase YrrM